MPNSAERPRRVTVDREGPLLIEGPVEVTDGDGTTHVSRRFQAAICTCRRSRAFPWCDTSHRKRRRATDEAATNSDAAMERGEP
ncbi:CDGSH iron-sulfur domain-containing protein [Streptomyces kunmingensis]|uniref:CDGSH iron-sulfur domain-containing protein n=1 Tax=Streptomyces kunmingensis TaxID=68225 RepID=A0ABU6CGT6_9ACTN|nr:CDGSH iron-sulfur domain-containing protein [Streptomyces kunmingensis]MEB3963925.1 CDGSH iron-sulfur domain-containing protein [Streptomyces kunmingensis]